MTRASPAPSPALPASPLAWPQSPRRSLLIFAAGSVIGLVLAGYSLFTTKGTTTRNPPPEDVALVNQRPILVSDFNAQLETQFGVPADQASKAQRAKVLQDMIREELFVQRGLELDMASSDPDVRSALVAAVEQQVAVDATAQTPTEAQLRGYYQTHKAAYSTEGAITLADLVFKGPPAQALTTARQAVDQLRAGAPPARFADHDSQAVKGEEFYFAARIHLGPALFEVAQRLDAGTVSDPLVTPDGVHVLVMAKNERPIAQSFEAASAKLLVDYKNDVQDRLDRGELSYLRDKADIKIAQAYR